MAKPPLFIPGRTRRHGSYEELKRDPNHQAHLTLHLFETLVPRVVHAGDLLQLIQTESVREILTGQLDDWSKKYGPRVKELGEIYYDVSATCQDFFRQGSYGHLKGAGLKGIDSPEAMAKLYEETREIEDGLGLAEELIRGALEAQMRRELNS